MRRKCTARQRTAGMLRLAALSFVWMGTVVSGQELPGGGERDLALRRGELARLAGRPQAVVPLTEIFRLRFNVRDKSFVRKLLEEAAASPKTNELARAYAEYYLSRMDVEAGDLAAAQRRRRRLGAIMDWFIVGPFDNEGKAGFRQKFAPEKGFDASATYEGPRGAQRWRSTKGLFPLGEVNLFDVFRPNLKVLAYAAAWVRVKQPVTLALRLASDDAVKVWVNGAECFSRDVYRPMTFDQDAAPIRLSAGWNLIMLKVAQDEGEWSFSARLTFPDGRAFTSFETASTLEAAARLRPPAPESPVNVKMATLRAVFEAAVKERPSSARAHGDLAWFHAMCMPDDVSDQKPVMEYRRAAELAPWYPVYFYELGRVQEEPNLSRLALERAVKLAPRFTLALDLLGAHYSRRGMFRQAMQYAKRAIALKPESPGPYVLKAYVLSQNQASGLGLRALMAQKARFPFSTALLNQAATLAKDVGKYALAKRLWEQTLASSYFNRDARLALAAAALKEGRLDACLKQYEELLKERPSYTPDLLREAEILRQWDKPAAAEALCRRAASICPQDDRAAALLGYCLHDQGKMQSALNAWRRALALKPQNAALREYMEFLKPDAAPFEADYVYDVRGLMEHSPSASQMPDIDKVILINLTVRKVHANGLDSRFRQVVFKVLTEKGARDLRAYNAPFVPNEQRFQSKRCRIFKPTGEIVAIAPARRVKMKRDKLIYSDTGVMQFRMPNVGVGDVIELQYQVDDIAARNSRAEYFAALVSLQNRAPCQRIEYVLITPKSKKIYFQTVGVDVKPKVEERGEEVIHVWRVDHTPPLVTEPHMPGWTEAAPYLHVSTYGKWEDLGRWYHGLIRDQFKLTDKGKKLAHQIADPKRSEREKIVALYQYLSLRVRYLGLEFGIHGNKPYPAWRVLERGYGDCKDKATLFCCMLREIGVDARYALVRTRGKGVIEPYPPSLYCFNHVIAYLPKYNWWLDCTTRYSGSRDLPPDDQGAMALIINPDGSSRLTTIPRFKADSNTYDSEYDVALKPDGSAAITVKRTITGRPAASYRARYAVKLKRRQIMERQEGKVFPGARVLRVSFSDLNDLERPVHYECRMVAPRFAERRDGKLSFSHNPMGQKMVRGFAPLSERRFPLIIAYPWRKSFHTAIHWQKGYKLEQTLDDVSLRSPFGRLERKVRRTPDGVKIDMVLEVDVWRVEPSDYAAFREFCTNVDLRLQDRMRIAK